ncbi:hypothetical protein ACN47E_004513 [Coniothyrium glycines]
MTVKSIKVTNYSPGTEYEWTDKTGSSESIKVIGAGNSEGAPQNTNVIQPSATASAIPLESGVNAPSATNGSKPSTTCTESEATGVNNPIGGSAPQTSSTPDTEDEPCECGTATVTVTGAPPATFTSGYNAIPPSSILTVVTSAQPPITPVVPSPPYPTTSGLEIDTQPAPSVPIPSAPTGVLPPRSSGSSTASAPPVQFTGAASQNKAGMFVGAVAGAMLLAF